MIDFYRTVGGRRFIDQTIPSLILALLKVAVAIDRNSALLEKAGGHAPTREAPPSTTEGDRG